ncbi:MAG: hypothetical protein SXA11_22820 [Cyanobacteriota bacterium]|nr:hypothetical protein [Cyanobacteriota bacterium]
MGLFSEGIKQAIAPIESRETGFFQKTRFLAGELALNKMAKVLLKKPVSGG